MYSLHLATSWDKKKMEVRRFCGLIVVFWHFYGFNKKKDFVVNYCGRRDGNNRMNDVMRVLSQMRMTGEDLTPSVPANLFHWALLQNLTYHFLCKNGHLNYKAPFQAILKKHVFPNSGHERGEKRSTVAVSLMPFSPHRQFCIIREGVTSN